MNTYPRRFVRWLAAFVPCLLGMLAACGSYEDKRIRELLPEKGFGARASGDATVENYVGGRDIIQFLLPPSVMGSIKLTVALVERPKCDLRTEWVNKKTSPGAPNTVMVDI